MADYLKNTIESNDLEVIVICGRIIFTFKTTLVFVPSTHSKMKLCQICFWWCIVDGFFKTYNILYRDSLVLWLRLCKYDSMVLLENRLLYIINTLWKLCQISMLHHFCTDDFDVSDFYATPYFVQMFWHFILYLWLHTFTSYET